MGIKEGEEIKPRVKVQDQRSKVYGLRFLVRKVLSGFGKTFEFFWKGLRKKGGLIGTDTSR
jgi:hypothetical protein